MADAQVIFETTVDTRKFQECLKNMGSGVSGMTKSVTGLASATSAAFGGNRQAQISKLTAELQKTDIQAEKLKARFQQVDAQIKKIQMKPTVSEEDAARIKVLSVRAEELAYKMAQAEEKGAQLGETIRRSVNGEPFKRLNNELNDTPKYADNAFSAIGRFASRLKRLVVAAFVFNVVRSGLSQLRDYLGGLLQTNAQFVKSVTQIKVALATAFQPIFEAVLPALNALMSALATAATYMAAFISMLFGKTLSHSQNAAKALNKQAGSLKNVGGAAEKAAKSLANFDQINQQAADTAGSSVSVDPSEQFDVGLPELDAGTTSFFEKAAGWIRDFIEAFKADPVQAVSDAIWNLIGGLFGLVKQISKPELSPKFLEALSAGLAVLIGAMAGAIVLKIPFPLALALSALATSGLVTLLGKDTAISLLAGAITGIASALLAYKLTGNLPLAIAIGAIMAALIPLLDRNTDLIMIPPALIGVASALLAFTKFKMSSISAGLLGISAALLSFVLLNDVGDAWGLALTALAGGLAALAIAIKTLKEGELLSLSKGIGAFAMGAGIALGVMVSMSDLSPELTIALGVLAGALVAVGTALTIGFGPVGWIVGAIAGLVTAIASIGIALSKDCIPEVKRFKNGISDATKDALDPFMDMLDETTLVLRELAATGGEITDEMVTAVVGNYRKMREQAIDEITRQRNETLDNLRYIFQEEATYFDDSVTAINSAYDEKFSALKNNTALTKEEYAVQLAALQEQKNNEILTLGEGTDEAHQAYLQRLVDMERHYDDKQIAIEDSEEQLRQTMKEQLVAGEELNQESLNTMLTQQDSFFETSMDALVADADERESIIRTRNENEELLAKQHVSAILTEAARERDESIAAAKKKHDGILAKAEELKKSGTAEAIATANSMIAEAERDKDESVRLAKDKYDGIMAETTAGLDGLDKEIDLTNGRIKSKWETFWTGIGDWFKGLWKGISSWFSDVWDSLTGKASSGANATSTSGIATLGSSAGISGSASLNPSQFSMPRLATGGLINAPTVAMIGERGREAVLPLDQNTGWMDTLADRLAEKMAGMQTGGDVVIQSDATMGQLVRLLRLELVKENSRAGYRIQPQGGMA